MADSVPPAVTGQPNAPDGQNIARIVTLTPKEGKTAELLGTLFEIRKTAFATGQCTQYVISHTADGSTVTEVIGWTSPAALETWAKDTLAPKIAELSIPDLLDGVKFHDVVPVVEE